MLSFELDEDEQKVLGRALDYAIAWCTERIGEGDPEIPKIQRLRQRLAVAMFGPDVVPYLRSHRARSCPLTRSRDLPLRNGVTTMTVKPRKPAIRRAREPGPQRAHKTPGPEQPVKPSGHPVKAPVTYEALQKYADDASGKLDAFKALVEDVYQILDGPPDGPQFPNETHIHDRVVIAMAKIADFDRRLPKIDGN